MANITVLVIDTETETIQKIMSALETEGYLVFTASDKDVSIRMASKINPSLIFVNIGMSGTSGLEICKAIHETESLEDIPIIMITPHEGGLDPRHKTVYGIVDTVKKPFSEEDIVKKASSVLGAMAIGAEPLEEEVAVEPYEEDIDVAVLEEKQTEVPLEEEIEVMAVEEDLDVQAIDEERAEEPFEEEITVQPFEEEELEIEPAREEVEIEGSEEAIGKGEEPGIIEKEIKEVYEEIPKEPSPEEAELTQMLEEADIDDAKKAAQKEFVEKEEHVIPEEPVAAEKPIEVEVPQTITGYKRRDSLYRGTRRRESSKGTKFLIAGIIIALLVLVGGGFLLYNFLVKEQEVKPPVIVKRERPAQEQPAQVQPSKEQKKPAQQVEQERKPAITAPAPTASVKPKAKPAPPHAAVPAVKPQAQTVYSVQLGAYRSKANADALVKQYRLKGYDAFTHESTTADKGTLHRVLIGKFDTRTKATEMMKQIKNKENVSALIYQGKI